MASAWARAANGAGRLMVADIVAPGDVMAQRVEEISSGLTICAEESDGSVSDETHWFDGATLALRPEHADLPTDAISAGAPLGGLPAEWPARLLLDGAVQAEGEIPASGTLVFGDPGHWVVEVLEAWDLGPHRPRASPNFSPAKIACRGTAKLLINEKALDRLQALSGSRATSSPRRWPQASRWRRISIRCAGCSSPRRWPARR